MIPAYRDLMILASGYREQKDCGRISDGETLTRGIFILKKQ
jgi:hypothetical protein